LAAPQAKLSRTDGARLGWTSYLKTCALTAAHPPVRLTVTSDAWRARLEAVQ
jgi:predicted component of type VI protein secretion system